MKLIDFVEELRKYDDDYEIVSGTTTGITSRFDFVVNAADKIINILPLN